jgi:hypothetical protein
VIAGLTSLILRVYACSLHFAAEDGVTELDGTDVRELANRVHTAAEKFSDSILPGEGGLAQVQQLFLTAIWLESIAELIKSGHALGKTIMAAYELGILSVPSFEDDLYEADVLKVFTNPPCLKAYRNPSGRKEDVYGLFYACGIGK